MGRYRGVDYIRQRICDVLAVSSKARWYFTYIDGQATGDHFRTIREMEAWIDSSLLRIEKNIMQQYHSTNEAVRILQEKGQLTDTVEADLHRSNGDRQALRVMKGGKQDKCQCAPWLLSDVFGL